MKSLKAQMRKVVFLAVLAVALLLIAAAPMAEASNDIIPAGLVIILSGVVIPAVIQLLRWISAWFKVTYSKNVLMGICYGLGVVVALIWLKPVLPAFPVWPGDPTEFTTLILDFVSGLVTLAGSVFGLATLLYRLFGDAVFGAFGIDSASLTSRVSGSTDIIDAG